MKFKYVPVLAAVLLLGSSGCEKDFLDTKIDIYATPVTIATDRATLFSFANAFYASLPYGFTSLDNNLFAAASDEAQQTTVYNTNAQIFNQGGLNSNSIVMSSGSGTYKSLYDGIRAANFFLDYSKAWRSFIALNRDTVSDPTGYNKDKLFMGWYRGEAHIARAYYYSELAKRYGGVHLITQTLQQSDNIQVAKAGYDEVVNFIVSEVDKYKDSLQADWKTSSYSDQDGRFTQGAALAIKSRVLLYAASPLHNTTNDIEKWKAAAAAANDVIKLNHYSLDASYGAYFIANNTLTSSETIFAVRRPADNAPETRNYPISTPGGSSGVTPSHNLVSDYEYIGTPDAADPYKNRDPRLSASIVTNGSSWNGRTIDESAGGTDDMRKANTSKTGYYLKKFLTDNLNLVQGGTALHHWAIFRYAEILLNYAEAMNEAYGPDGLPSGYTLTARQALQMVRARASSSLPAVTITSVSAFRDVVKHERRIELAFEDHRYWDLLRWKDAETVLNQPIQGVSVTKSATGAFSYQVFNAATRVFKSSMYYYPFSQSEIVNSNGLLVQNPGY